MAGSVTLNSTPNLVFAVTPSAGGGTVNGLTEEQLRSAPIDANVSGSVGISEYLVGDRVEIDAVAGVIAQTPYVSFKAGTTQFCQPDANSGKKGDIINSIKVFVTATNATLTLVDGTGLNGAINQQLLPSPAVVGMTRIPLDDLPSKDGGWSLVATGCAGWIQGNC